MDNAPSVVGFALAALAGGAVALRIESVDYVRAVRAQTNAPIIGIVKQDRSDSPVRITPTLDHVTALCAAGADIIAVDATHRPRPVPVAALIGAIKGHGRLAMADCADLDDARAALAAGADFVGSTLSGYTGGAIPDGPDFPLLARMRELTPYVLAEGRIHTPAQAAEALRHGALGVVVGSALTRTEHATAWLRQAMDQAAETPAGPVLAIDIGGTKTVAALVDGPIVSAAQSFPTDRAGSPDSWLSRIADLFVPRGGFVKVAAAVTGIVERGQWSALNPATLALPLDYPLVATLERLFEVPACAANDAQAAAWGEYRYGAGAKEDMVFLTISTGVGGGIVTGGRPRLGLAGHVGLLQGVSGSEPIENIISGRWIAATARSQGHGVSAVDVFAAAANGEAWAAAIIDQSAHRVARLCADLQLLLDPRRIVIGGGIGLAPGFLTQVEAHLTPTAPRLRPHLAPAQLGASAGLIGITNLSRRGWIH